MAVNHRAEVVKSVCRAGPGWTAWRGRTRGPQRRLFPADARHNMCAKPSNKNLACVADGALARVEYLEVLAWRLGGDQPGGASSGSCL